MLLSLSLSLSTLLGTAPVVDAEEEAFVVFSQDIPSQSLGFVDPQASALDITVAGYDLTIRQSRGLLTSDRKEGTTGAVLWRITPLLAAWLCSPTNILTTSSLLSSNTTVLELGAGISGVLALTLAPRVAQYTATDQDYVLRLLRQNVAENLHVVLPKEKRRKPTREKTVLKHTTSRGGEDFDVAGGKIKTEVLDWETTDTSHLSPVDLIIACDCIYNDALIEPLNLTCAAISRLRHIDDPPTICLIAQQLRSPEVFESWLKSFSKLFEVCQVPDRLLDEGLREGSGFVVHMGILRR